MEYQRITSFLLLQPSTRGHRWMFCAQSRRSTAWSLNKACLHEDSDQRRRHIAEAEVESGRIFAQRLARSPYLKSWDASWPDSGRGIAELRSARKYGGLNQRYFDSTSPPIEPRCTAADCAEVGLGSLGRRLREHCSGKPLLRPSSALVGKLSLIHI